jgi:hypothetical protein
MKRLLILLCVLIAQTGAPPRIRGKNATVTVLNRTKEQKSTPEKFSENSSSPETQRVLKKKDRGPTRKRNPLKPQNPLLPSEMSPNLKIEQNRGEEAPPNPLSLSAMSPNLKLGQNRGEKATREMLGQNRRPASSDSSNKENSLTPQNTPQKPLKRPTRRRGLSNALTLPLLPPDEVIAKIDGAINVMCDMTSKSTAEEIMKRCEDQNFQRAGLSTLRNALNYQKNDVMKKLKERLRLHKEKQEKLRAQQSQQTSTKPVSPPRTHLRDDVSDVLESLTPLPQTTEELRAQQMQQLQQTQSTSTKPVSPPRTHMVPQSLHLQVKIEDLSPVSPPHAKRSQDNVDQLRREVAQKKLIDEQRELFAEHAQLMKRQEFTKRTELEQQEFTQRGDTELEQLQEYMALLMERQTTLIPQQPPSSEVASTLPPKLKEESLRVPYNNKDQLPHNTAQSLTTVARRTPKDTRTSDPLPLITTTPQRESAPITPSNQGSVADPVVVSAVKPAAAPQIKQEHLRLMTARSVIITAVVVTVACATYYYYVNYIQKKKIIEESVANPGNASDVKTISTEEGKANDVSKNNHAPSSSAPSSSAEVKLDSSSASIKVDEAIKKNNTVAA